LTGSLRTAEKRRLQRDLAAGEIHTCIGTQALIQEAVSFQSWASQSSMSTPLWCFAAR